MGPAGNSSNFLDLTPDQQQKILVIQQDFQKETLSLRFEMQKKNMELRQLWAAKPLNQAAIDPKTKEITALNVQLTTKAQAMQEKIKSVLIPEQLKKANDNNIFGYGPGFGGPGMRGGRMGCSF